jgi:hypothetical protein
VAQKINHHLSYGFTYVVDCINKDTICGKSQPPSGITRDLRVATPDRKTNAENGILCAICSWTNYVRVSGYNAARPKKLKSF